MPAERSPGTGGLRPYEPSDAEAIVEVWRAASELATPFLSEVFLRQEADNIRHLYLPQAETWVCEDARGVVGFLSLLGNEVGAIFVHPAAQGLGYGRRLMDHAVELCGDVYLDVFEDNASGRGFYGRYGFVLDHKHVHEETGFSLLRLRYEQGRRS